MAGNRTPQGFLVIAVILILATAAFVLYVGISLGGGK